MSKTTQKSEKLLLVSSSPHIRKHIGVNSIMIDVLIALIPASIAAVIFFGLRALALIVFCTASSVLLEFLYRKFMKLPNTISDFSAAVTGILLALNLPSTFPFWMAFIGCFFAIIIGKQLFGGIGKNFANPAIVGRIILLISFGSQMSNFVANNFELDISTYATPLVGGVLKNKTYFDLFIGNRGGSIGETCILALLIGFAYLVIKKVITLSIPLSYFGTVVVMSLIFGVDPLFHLMSGGIVLGGIFMATDYVSSPSTEKGKIIYGIGIGVINMVIRQFASYPEGTSFAILFMNVLTPHIESLTRPKAFGEVKVRGEK